MHEDKLYAIAMQCAQLNYDGCSCACHLCQFNVYNYVHDVREASLLKANAYTDFNNRRQINDRINHTQNAMTITPLILILIIVGLLAYCCSSMKSCLEPAPVHSYTAPQQTAPGITQDELRDMILQFFMDGNPALQEQMTIDDEIRFLRNNQNKLENVPRILRVMQQQGVRDINRDGKIDCIDYSLRFRELYGSGAHIMINVNPQTSMNHMFIRIWYDSGRRSMDIEPQGTPERYSMGVIWGVRYNPAYSRDVTSQWSHVVGGM